MAYRAGSAFISITPSFRGFNEKIRAHVKTISTVKIPVKVEVQRPKRPITVPVKSPTIKPKVDNSAAFRGISRLESRLDRLSRGRFLINMGIAAAPLAIPAGAAALGAGAAAGVVGGAAAAGVGGFAAISAAALKPVLEARKALSKAEGPKERKKILQGLTGDQVKALSGVNKLNAAWGRFLDKVGGPVLGSLVRGMSGLEKALRPLSAFIKPVARAMGGLFDQLGSFAGSDEFTQFARSLGKFAGGVLKDAAPSLLNLARGFMDLFDAFKPLGKSLSSALPGLTKKFADWTASFSKSKGFRDFIDYVKTNGPVLVSVVKDVISAVVEIGIALAPMASAMLKGLGVFARWLAEFSKAHPVIIRFVAGALVASSAVSALAGPLAKIVGLGRAVLGPVRLLTKGFQLMRGAALGTRIGLIALKVQTLAVAAAQKIAAVASKVFAVATRLVNAAMKANPIGIVITLLVALAAGLIYAYKHSETFRRIVDAAWRGIKAAAKAVVGWFKDTAWPWMKKVFTQIGDIAQWTWKHVLKPSFDATKKAFGWVGDKFHTVWTKVLRPLFVQLTKGWMTVVSGILDGAAKAFGWVPGVGPKLEKAAKEFHKFKNRVNSALDNIDDKHVDVSTKVLTKYGSGTVRWLRQNGGLAGGGTVHGPRAPYGDKVLQPLAPGEEVISNRFGQADRYRPILKAINANRVVPGLADGGTVFGFGTSGLGSAAEKFGTIAADVNRANSSILSTLLRNMSSWFSAHPMGGPKATGGWRDLWHMINSRFSGAILTSAFRPGATVAGFPGVLSRHGMGKAIDIAVNRRIWDWLVPQRNRFFELLGPWGMWRKGSPWHNPITAANHKDHIHISAYANGTMSARPGWAWVGERGPELVRFRGGERVLSNQQSQAQSSGPTFNTTINAPSDDAQAIWREFHYEFRRQSLAGVYG